MPTRKLTRFLLVLLLYTFIFRIDFFLVDKITLQDVTDSEIGSITWFDHAPVSTTVGNFGPRIPSLWRLNTSLITDPNNIQKLTTEHHSYFELNDNPGTDRFVLWSAYKAYMHGILIKLHNNAKNQRSGYVEEVLSQIAGKPKQTGLFLQTSHQAPWPEAKSLLTFTLQLWKQP